MENICNLCKGMFPLEDNVFECEFCNKKYEEKINYKNEEKIDYKNYQFKYFLEESMIIIN